MLELEDLKYKPNKDSIIEIGTISVCEIEKQFHFGCLTLNLGINLPGAYGRLFSMINIGDEYMSNILNLIFELFKDHMNSTWEYLKLSDLVGLKCCCIVEEGEMIAIGRKDKWINQKEVLQLLKEARR